MAGLATAAAAPRSGGWSAPQRVGTGSDISHAQVELDGSGNAVAVWTATAGRATALYAAVRPRRASRWLPPVRLSPKSAHVGPVDVAADPRGDVVIAYVDESVPKPARVEVVVGSTHGTSWKPPRAVGAATCCGETIAVGIDAAGHAIVLFRGPKRLTAASGAARTGSFRLEPLAVASRLAQYPLLSVDGRGDALASWTRCTPGDRYVCSLGSPARWESSTRVAGSGSWSPPRLVTAAAGDDDHAPSRAVVLTESGTAVAVWLNGTLFAATKPLYQPWRKPVRVTSEEVAFDDYATDPQTISLAAQGAAGALLVWSADRAGAARLEAGVWRPSQVGPRVASSAESHPVVASAGDGSVVAWQGDELLTSAAVGVGDGWQVADELGSGLAEPADAAVDAAGDAVVLWASEHLLEASVYAP